MKIIQIAVSESEDTFTLIVLLEDGSLWATGNLYQPDWRELPLPPRASVNKDSHES